MAIDERPPIAGVARAGRPWVLFKSAAPLADILGAPGTFISEDI